MGLIVQSSGVPGHNVSGIQQACQVAYAQYTSLVVPSLALYDCTSSAVSASIGVL